MSDTATLLPFNNTKNTNNILGLLFNCIQKAKYRYFAQNRHDIHSPFVYDFVEKVINAKMKMGTIPQFLSHLSPKQQSIIARSIIFLNATEIIIQNQQIILEEKEDGLSQKIYVYEQPSDFKLGANEQDIAIALNQHSAPQELQIWNEIINNSKVTLSLNLFDIGFVFGKKEFLVKQHFVLKT